MTETRRSFLRLSAFGSLPLHSSVLSTGRAYAHQPTELLTLPSLVQLRALPTGKIEPGTFAMALGRTAPFDGHGGFYVWDGLSVHEDSETFLKAQGTPTGGWHRVIPGIGNARLIGPGADTFGARGDIKSDDTAALQSLIDAVDRYSVDLGKAGYVPAGLYRLTATLIPPSYSRIYGDGPHQSVLYNFQHPIPHIPAFTARGSLTFSTFEDIGLQSQRAGFDVTGVTDHNTFRNMKLYGMADAAFRFRGPLQTSLFDRILVENCRYGLVCENTVVNRNTLREPEFKDCTDSCIKLAGAEDLLIIGGRFEGAGSAGRTILDVENVHLLSFLGGYFEASHEYLLKARKSDGLISFDSVHFTYFEAGTPYKWDVDSGCQLVFRNCHSSIPMRVPRSSILEGYNRNIMLT